MGESFDHRPPGWIRQSGKCRTQFIHNHMVVDFPAMSSMNFAFPDCCSLKSDGNEWSIADALPRTGLVRSSRHLGFLLAAWLRAYCRFHGSCSYRLHVSGARPGGPEGWVFWVPQSHPRSPVRTKIVRRGTRWPQERERGEDGAPGLSSPVPESEGPGAPGGLATPAHRDETAMNGAQLFRDPLLFPCSLFPISWTLAFYFLFPVSCFLFLGPWLSISCSLFLVPCSLPSAIPCCLAARTWLPGGPGPG